MRLNQFKTVMIVFLAFSAMYLTGRLWFETFSNRNFFYSVIYPFAPAQPERDGQVLKPYRFVVNPGASNFTIYYDGLDENPQKQACDRAIELALRKGEFTETGELNWNSLLAGKAYLYDYSFPVPADFFAEAPGQKTVNLASRIKAVDAVSVAPSRTGGDKLTVTFVDEAGGLACAYSVSGGSLNETLLSGLAAPENGPDDIFYVSSRQKELAMFTGNNFVPQWLGESYTYGVARMSNPYAPKGDLILHSIQPGVEPLFDSVVYSGLAGGIYTFSDENTVVRYYPDDTLEYADYHIVDKPANPTMASNYRAALVFLKKDAGTITNDYYLSGVESADDGVYTFYFDYNVNGFPLKLPMKFALEVKMRSPIIVTAQDNRVSKYKKLVYNFYVDEEYNETATVPFIDSYNGILGGLPEGADADSARINHLSLAYKMEKGKYLRLHWFMDMNGGSFVIPAQFTGNGD